MLNILIVFTAKYLFILVVLISIGITLLASKQKKREIIRLSILALPISFILAKILSFFINDPRPFVLEHIQPLIAHIADNGFPSDHTLLTMTIAAIFFQFNRKLGILLSLLALLVGISRVLAKVHHPLDIRGSIVIAYVAVFF